MLYQVIHQHTPEQCPANHEGRTEAMNNAINEAHESGAVKILSWLHNSPSHRIFFVIEAHKYEDVQIMFDSMRLWGAWEIIPVLDPNASRSVRHEGKVMKGLGLKKLLFKPPQGFRFSIDTFLRCGPYLWLN